MVAVRGVVVGGQRRREQLAGAVADVAQERALCGSSPFQSSRDGDAGAVGQAEAGDVDRVGGARARSSCSNRCRRCGGNCSCRNARSSRRARRSGVRAAGWTTSHSHIASAAATGQATPSPAGAKRDPSRDRPVEPHAVGIAALPVAAARRQDGVADAGAVEQRAALREILGQRGELAAREQADRLGRDRAASRAGPAAGRAALAHSISAERRDDDQRDEPADRPSHARASAAHRVRHRLRT